MSNDTATYLVLTYVVDQRVLCRIDSSIATLGAQSWRAVLQVVSVGGMILAGLHHIHQRNIIHRDLHVDNILYVDMALASHAPVS